MSRIWSGRPATSAREGEVNPLLETAWPLASRLGLSREDFIAALEPRLGDGESLDLEGLTMAAACLAQLPAALRELDERLLPQVRAMLRRRAQDSVVDDVLQQARVKLVVATPPALAQYRGKGPLQGFIRAVAVHLLANLEAGSKSGSSEDESLASLPDTAEVEAGLVRADQQLHFKEAFAQAVGQLSPKQRALLRLNLLDALSIDEIAPLYQAHRSSIARWLAEAREELAQRTKAQLALRLRLDGEALESLLRSVQQHFDLSLASALRQP